MLPDRPTSILLQLLESIIPKSRPDPRPSNPLGRKAPSAAFAVVCQRHHFEADWLPQARARGWPTFIDFARVRLRVEKIKGELQAILNDAGPLRNASDPSKRSRHHGPRQDSSFWKEALRDIKSKGTKAAAGVAGQFHSFEKTQPG
jgi:hypothetical protein